MRRFDRVSTISKKMLESLAREAWPMNNAFFFRTGWIRERFYPLPGRNLLREELGIPEGAVTALYAGNMAGSRAGNNARCGAYCRRRRTLRFVMCGDGAAAKDPPGVWRPFNVIWLPLQPAARLNELLNLAVSIADQLAGVADW